MGATDIYEIILQKKRSIFSFHLKFRIVICIYKMGWFFKQNLIFEVFEAKNSHFISGSGIH